MAFFNQFINPIKREGEKFVHDFEKKAPPIYNKAIDKIKAPDFQVLPLPAEPKPAIPERNILPFKPDFGVLDPIFKIPEVEDWIPPITVEEPPPPPAKEVIVSGDAAKPITPEGSDEHKADPAPAGDIKNAMVLPEKGDQMAELLVPILAIGAFAILSR